MHAGRQALSNTCRVEAVHGAVFNRTEQGEVHCILVAMYMCSVAVVVECLRRFAGICLATATVTGRVNRTVSSAEMPSAGAGNVANRQDSLRGISM